MATEFDPRRSIPPPESAELTPEDKARQRIVEHLQDAELESPRFQAFADYTDLQNSHEWLPRPNRIFNADMVRETTRQRINGTKGYKREYEQVQGMVDDYWRVCKDTSFDPPMAQSKFAQFLMEIKNQEIEKKS